MAAYTAVDDPSAHFKVQLYTGNGSANNAITFDDTDTDMQPDFVWIKNTDASDSHCWFDAVRGVTKVINCDSSDAPTTDTDTLDAFQSDGFRVDADVKVNTNTEVYAAFCWKGNGTGSSNTDGSINTAATSANTTAGFSINTYTGTGSAATVGHGLGAVPGFICVKNLSEIQDWRVYHDGTASDPGTDNLVLNSTAAVADSAAKWNDTDATSTVFSLGDNHGSNKSGDSLVAYVWADVQGFSKFGSYEGNNNADGTFVYTGFRPRWVMLKNIDATEPWLILDSIRDSNGNPTNAQLEADSNGAQSDANTSRDTDFLANGFKLRFANAALNSAATFVYAAFAEAPFVNSNGVPCNAK